MGAYKDVLYERVFDTESNLLMAFKLKNKDLYKFCLAQLQLDCGEFFYVFKFKHEVEERIQGYYEKLWDI